MAEIIRGGGEQEHHRPERKPHKDYIYRSKQSNLTEYPSPGHKLAARKAELEGGHHVRSNINGKPFTLADFVEFHGDRLGLIHIAALIPHRRKIKHARKRR